MKNRCDSESSTKLKLSKERRKMATARSVTFADEIHEIHEIKSNLSGRIAMIDDINVKNLSHTFEKVAGLKDPQNSDIENSSPPISENTSVRFEYDERFSNGCKISFGKKFGSKGNGYGELQDATDVVTLSNGNILVSDMINSKLQVFNQKGSPTVAYILDELIEPRGITLTPDEHIAACSQKIQAITVLSPDGCLVGTFGQNILSGPCGIATNLKGNFVITDVSSNKVCLVDKNGNFIQHIGKDEYFKQPRYVTVSKRGEIIVSDSGNNCLKVFDPQGNLLRVIGKFGKDDGCLKVPYATTTDDFGNILVSDHYNDRISVFNSNGKFLRHIVTEAHGLKHPQGLSLSSEMVLYVSHGGLKANQVAAYELNFDGIPCDVVAFV